MHPKKSLPRNALIVFLVCISALGIFKYAGALKEKYELLGRIYQLKIQIGALERDKQALCDELKREKELEARLSAQIAGLKAYLKASRKRLGRSFGDYAASDRHINDLSARALLLEAENRALTIEKDRLSQLARENEELKAKLNSIAELKKAIRELKKRKSRGSVQLSSKGRPRLMPVAGGNSGYLLKDGKSTYPGIARIEVVPAKRGE